MVGPDGPMSGVATLPGLQPGDLTDKQPVGFRGPGHTGERPVVVAWEDDDGQHEEELLTVTV